jgi:hypothetical protein
MSVLLLSCPHFYPLKMVSKINQQYFRNVWFQENRKCFKSSQEFKKTARRSKKTTQRQLSLLSWYLFCQLDMEKKINKKLIENWFQGN